MNSLINVKANQTEPSSALETCRLFQAVASHPLLKGLNESQLRTLSNSAMLKEFKAGETIFVEGEMANRFYLILEGKVALESHFRDEEPTQIQQIGAGDVLGWSWLFPPYYWHFDARAVEPTKAIFFYGTRLREDCEHDKTLGYELMKRMSEVMIARLQATRKQLLALRAKVH